MADNKPRTFAADFKRFFGRGLGVLLPSVLTLWILVKAYQFVDSAIAQPINAGIRAGVAEGAEHWPLLGREFLPTEAQIDAEVAQQRASKTGSDDRIVVQRELTRRGELSGGRTLGASDRLACEHHREQLLPHEIEQSEQPPQYCRFALGRETQVAKGSAERVPQPIHRPIGKQGSKATDDCGNKAQKVETGPRGRAGSEVSHAW